MPKKYQNRALLTKPTSSAPSTLKSNHQSVTNHGEPQERTVNDLIRESRITKSNNRTIDSAASSSLPPALREVLDLPAPPVRRQIYGPARLRRIPGPPPPQSWLSNSQHAPENARDGFMQLRWLRARTQQQASTLPGHRFPAEGSLEEMVLRAIAMNWEWHAEYDHIYLATLPVRIRETLLSFLAVYDDAHSVNPLPFLFPLDCDQDELDGVTRLDLANSLGSWATVKKIERELLLSSSRVIPNIEQREEVIPESWDEAAELPVAPEPVLRSLRFVNLKHLSLAINPASAGTPPSWASLLSLASGLSTLTSLSLAHWPVPSYTPNASKGRFTIQAVGEGSRPQIMYGGTDYYSISDRNWQEASGILRSLSRHLYCLTWLNLSGCGTWFEALTYNPPKEDISGPDWNGGWRNVTRLDLSIGWLPGKLSSRDPSSASYSNSSIDSTRAIEQLYGNSEVIQQSLAQLTALRLGSRPPLDEGQPAPWNVEEEREKHYFRRDVERYRAQQYSALTVSNEIRSMRRKAGGTWISVELGPRLNEDEIKLN